MPATAPDVTITNYVHRAHMLQDHITTEQADTGTFAFPHAQPAD